MSTLGERLRQLRQARGLSLAEVASQTGLTTGFLSQTERDLANPSISSLREICRVLDVPLFHLFIDEEPARHVVRKGERRVIPLGRSDVERYERLSPIAPNLKLEMLLLTLEPGHANQDQYLSHPGEEIALCLSGVFRIEVKDHESVILNAGDAIYLDSTQPHRYVNVGDTRGQLLFATTPPGY